jgi:deoxyribonuclease-4
LAEVRRKHDLRPLVVHDNYLINLASADALIRSKSIAAFREELERSSVIGAEYVVAHPGSYRRRTIEEGIEAFVDGVAQAARGLSLGKLMLLVEGTAGSGAALGSRFEQLHAIRDLAAQKTDLPVGYCLDTCHLLAAGYDVASEQGLRIAVRQMDEILGLENLKVIHANDSKGPLGSHKDRHENIGKGHIGRNGFRRILAHPRLRSKPFILETPIDREGDDRRNLETLKRLCPKRRTTTTKSS